VTRNRRAEGHAVRRLSVGIRLTAGCAPPRAAGAAVGLVADGESKRSGLPAPPRWRRLPVRARPPKLKRSDRSQRHEEPTRAARPSPPIWHPSRLPSCWRRRRTTELSPRGLYAW